MNDELDRAWTVGIVADFKVLLWNWRGRTEGNVENRKSRQPVTAPPSGQEESAQDDVTWPDFSSAVR
jgi:hypothetical protein